MLGIFLRFLNKATACLRRSKSCSGGIVRASRRFILASTKLSLCRLISRGINNKDERVNSTWPTNLTNQFECFWGTEFCVFWKNDGGWGCWLRTCSGANWSSRSNSWFGVARVLELMGNGFDWCWVLRKKEELDDFLGRGLAVPYFARPDSRFVLMKRLEFLSCELDWRGDRFWTFEHDFQLKRQLHD